MNEPVYPSYFIEVIHSLSHAKRRVQEEKEVLNGARAHSYKEGLLTFCGKVCQFRVCSRAVQSCRKKY